MSDELHSTELHRLAADIVSAHVSKNSMPADRLSDLIRTVYAALNTADNPPDVVEARPNPAVPIKKSVFPDYIICLEDGKKLKMLKRHLLTSYGMTPDDYRARWGLSSDYPIVAPNYAAQRSSLAKQIGLGRKPEPVPAPIVDSSILEVPEVAVQRIPQRKRGRKPGSKNRVAEELDLVPE
jgi:predicted transcriptional regulator